MMLKHDLKYRFGFNNDIPTIPFTDSGITFHDNVYSCDGHAANVRFRTEDSAIQSIENINIGMAGMLVPLRFEIKYPIAFKPKAFTIVLRKTSNGYPNYIIDFE